MDPFLIQATSLDKSAIGECMWSAEKEDYLTISNHGKTVSWDKVPDTDKYAPAWVQAPTLTQLHSGTYKIEFLVEAMGGSQIGVGFMLKWNIGLDWGFYGYLGASTSAWAYDPSTGDVVYNTNSI